MTDWERIKKAFNGALDGMLTCEYREEMVMPHCKYNHMLCETAVLERVCVNKGVNELGNELQDIAEEEAIRLGRFENGN